ncbi:unnamed protein product [Closterium sp. NIES-54]
MITRPKGLGEDISSVGTRCHVGKAELTTLLQLTGKKVVKSNVLRSVLQSMLCTFRCRSGATERARRLRGYARSGRVKVTVRRCRSSLLLACHCCSRPPATAACRLDYATALIAEFESAIPPSVGSESALGTDVLGDRQEDFECLAVAVPRFASMLLAPEGDPDAPDIPTPRSYAEAITGPFSSQWQATMDAEMASWKSTGTYVNAVPPSRVNIVDGMRIFRVKRPRGSPPALKARYVARGFSKRHGVH